MKHDAVIKLDLCTLSGERGFSLVEVLVAVGILSIVIYGFLTMFDVQYRQVKGLNQRLETVELKTLVIQQLSKSDSCTWQLKDRTVDLSAVTTSAPSPTALSLDNLYMGPVGSPLLAQKGSPLPGTQSDIWVDKILFKDIVSTGTAGEFIGTLEISFDTAHLVTPIRPIAFKRVVSIDPSTGKITNCGAPSQSVTQRFCNTYGFDPPYASADSTTQKYMLCASPDVDGACHITNSENAIGCFLAGMDDDTGRMIVSPTTTSPWTYVTSSATYTSPTVLVQAAFPQKCEIMKDTASGGWKARAWFGCDYVTCSYTCIFGN